MKDIMLNVVFVINIILISTLGFMNFLWADSNGIFLNSEDIVPGTFGADEQGGNTTFVFINNVKVMGKVGVKTNNPQFDLDINGTLIANNLRNIQCPPGEFIQSFDENSTPVCGN